MKKYIKSLSFTFLSIIILTFLITILNYIGLASGLFFSILKLIVPIISIFIGGLIIGVNSNEKGWLNGLKVGIIIILIFTILIFILKENLSLKLVIYYLILLSLSVFGSMIGISKNNQN